MDGGSTDGSVEIVRRYEAQLHRWCSEPDGGHYAAVNKGFSWSTGEIMAWLNSDDMYCPWALRTVASIFEQFPEVRWLTTLNPIVWDYHGYCWLYPVGGYSRESYLDGCHFPTGSMAPIQQESTFWRRELWEEAGGEIRPDYPLAGDFDLWGMFFRHADLHTALSPLGGFRTQERQRSRQRSQYIAEASRSIEGHREALRYRISRARAFARAVQIHRVPRVRNWLSSIAGYRGKVIRRCDGHRPDGRWEIQESFFF